MRYLLDTNIISDFIQNPKGRVANHIRRVGREAVFTSVIVAAELRFGVAKNASFKFERRVEETLQALVVEPFEPPADTAYGVIRANLEKQGRLIGANDLFIAAHALSLGCTLVTANEREFARIDGLRCENWLR